MPAAEQWLPRILRESTAGSGLAETFSDRSHILISWQAQCTRRATVRHSPPPFRARGGEASPDNMQVQKLGHQRSSLTLLARSALVVSKPRGLRVCRTCGRAGWQHQVLVLDGPPSVLARWRSYFTDTMRKSSSVAPWMAASRKK